jgi:hypothetical protein
MQYFGYLRRNPNDAPDADHTGFDFWLTKLNQFNGDFIKRRWLRHSLVQLNTAKGLGPEAHSQTTSHD